MLVPRRSKALLQWGQAVIMLEKEKPKKVC